MFDIEIKKPIDINIKIMEFEEHKESINVLINCFIMSLQEKAIEINNRVWIECSLWDNFISQIYGITKGECLNTVLKDLSNKNILEISRETNEIIVSLYYDKNIMSGIEIHSLINVAFDEEQLYILYDRLNSIDKWW